MPGDYALIVNGKTIAVPYKSPEGEYLTNIHKVRNLFSAQIRSTKDKDDDKQYVEAAKEFYKVKENYIKETGKSPTDDSTLVNFMGLKNLPKDKPLIEYFFNKKGLFLTPEKIVAESNK